MPKHYARIRGGRPINIMGCRPWERRRQKRWLKTARLAECGKKLDDRNKTWYYIQLRPTMADMRHNEKIHLQKCVEKLLLSGQSPCVKHCENRLVMRPPELHVVLQFHMRPAENIHEIEESAVSTVQPEFILFVCVFRGAGNQRFISGGLAAAHHEPHGFQPVPGIDETPFAALQIK